MWFMRAGGCFDGLGLYAMRGFLHPTKRKEITVDVDDMYMFWRHQYDVKSNFAKNDDSFFNESQFGARKPQLTFKNTIITSTFKCVSMHAAKYIHHRIHKDIGRARMKPVWRWKEEQTILWFAASSYALYPRKCKYPKFWFAFTYYTY